MQNQFSFLSKYMQELIELEVPQFEILDNLRFVNFLRVRDIRVSKEELEHFEKIGFLYPVLRLKRSKVEENGKIRYSVISSSAWHLKKYLKTNLLEFPTSMNFRPWGNYRDKNGEENTFIYYHPYQVFLIDRFLNLTQITLTSAYIEEAASCEKMFEQAKKMHKHVKEAFQNARPKLIKQIGLLLQLQNAYQPSYRGIIHLTWDEESPERWIDWKKNVFSPSKVLKDNKMSLRELTELRDYFAAQAHSMDPMSSWYTLIRLVPFSEKERLKGKALLAQDYYEVVGILNFFLRDLTGEEQPEPDDIMDGTHGRWKDNYYGKKFDYKDEDIRRKIVSDYLYVTIPKLVLLVEGYTEETSIRILMNTLGIVPEIKGIAIINFEGTGGITFRNAGPVLQAAKSQNVARYLIVDNDKDAAGLVKELSERRKLLDGDCYRIWETDFEQDNFGLDTVVETVNGKLVESGLAPIEPSEVRNRMADHPNEKLWKAIHNVCWEKNSVELGILISKISVSRALTIKRTEEIRQETKEKRYKPKWKIEEEIGKIYEKYCR